MTLDTKILESFIAEQNSSLEQILAGIADGIMEGIKEGILNGLQKGFKEGLKDSLSKGIIGTGDIDFSEVVEEIIEDVARTSLKEGARNIVSKPSEIYMQRICSRIVSEVTKRDVKLTESDIRQIESIVLNIKQRTTNTLLGRLPENPFIKEIAGGIRIALEDSLQREITSCRERLTQAMRGQ